MEEKNIKKQLLDAKTIPKFLTQLPILPVFKPKKCIDKNYKCYHEYNVFIDKKELQILPYGFPKTTVFVYGGLTYPNTSWFSSPGPTFEAVRNVPIHVNWINNIKDNHILPVDYTLHWANPNKIKHDIDPEKTPFPPGVKLAQHPVPIVTHVHGAETDPIFDGHPEAWITFNGLKGSQYKTSYYKYLNKQQSSTLWYHDHTIGITRLNVYAGLSGFYIIRDCSNILDDPKITPFPKGKYEISLIIQDKSFYEDGSLYFPTEGNNPDIHPYWKPSFYGDTILVNGKTWPNLNVEQRAYRFRILNGSTERFYLLKMSDNTSFLQIGTDGGYLPKPVRLNSLLIVSGQRADIIIDFSDIPINTKIILENLANELYPIGQPPDKDTTANIMQFTVKYNSKYNNKNLNIPKILNKIPKLCPNMPKRRLVFNFVSSSSDIRKTYITLLNGQRFTAPCSENVIIGSTEIWEIASLGAVTHTVHVHLVQFQLLNYQKFDVEAYKKDWLKLNPNLPLNRPTVNLPVDKYLIGEPTLPKSNELGWVDTIRTNLGEVTRILIRFAPTCCNSSKVKIGENLFPFDPTKEPGYVWHCHMLSHEDNDMMRPFTVNKIK